MDRLAPLAPLLVGRLQAEIAEDGRVEGERAVDVTAHEVDVAEPGEHYFSIDSTSSVETSTPRNCLPTERTPSSSITVQNGHATASVSAPVSAASRTRSSLMGVPRSSIHMCAPPAPQQNVCLPLRFISVVWPITFSSLRGSMRPSLWRAR